MKQLKVTLVFGARPQIVKSAPFIHLANKDKEVNLTIIHTGQHYDYEMTKIFFEEPSLPDPIANLNVGSGIHAQQTAKTMLRLEKILQKQKPTLVIVPGDTNSTLAGALTAAKLHTTIHTHQKLHTQPIRHTIASHKFKPRESMVLHVTSPLNL